MERYAKAIIVSVSRYCSCPAKVGEDNKSPVGAPGAPWSTGIPIAARLKSRRQSVYRHPGGLENSLTSAINENHLQYAIVRLSPPYHRYNRSDRARFPTHEHQAYTGDTHDLHGSSIRSASRLRMGRRKRTRTGHLQRRTIMVGLGPPATCQARREWWRRQVQRQKDGSLTVVEFCRRLRVSTVTPRGPRHRPGGASEMRFDTERCASRPVVVLIIPGLLRIPQRHASDSRSGGCFHGPRSRMEPTMTGPLRCTTLVLIFVATFPPAAARAGRREGLADVQPRRPR